MSGPVPLRVLVAVDFGEASAAAVALAGAIAQAVDARLAVMHAETLDVPPYFTPAQVDALERERRQARRAAAAFLGEFAARHTDAAFEARVVDGPAREAILDASGDADLLVLGTHGRRGPRRWWLGSVAEGVVSATRTPVLITCALGEDARRRLVDRLRAMTAAVGPSWLDAVGGALDATMRTGDREAVTQAVRTCGVPLLFVPEAPGARERSLS